MDDRLPVMKKPAPKPKTSRKLIIFLFVFFITLLLVLFFRSTLSTITSITVAGQQLVSEEEIMKAAEVHKGENFFSVSSGDIENRIRQLRMVESVEVTKHFPGKLEIQVQEYPKVAYQLGDNGQIEALLADASIVPVNAQGVVLDKPILTGWNPEDPLKRQLCLVMADMPAAYFATISEIKPAPSASYPDKIKLYARSGYEVHTTIGFLPVKMRYLEAYIAKLKENGTEGGIITLLDADYHAPAEAPKAGEGQTGQESGGQGTGNTELVGPPIPPNSSSGE